LQKKTAENKNDLMSSDVFTSEFVHKMSRLAYCLHRAYSLLYCKAISILHSSLVHCCRSGKSFYTLPINSK